MEIYITIDHFNKTITIDDCIFEEPYEQELRQYLWVFAGEKIWINCLSFPKIHMQKLKKRRRYAENR